MGSKFSQGFTIIEVMLFLAITGLLLAGILASTSRSLSDQRYREGVESVRSKIGAQFTKVYSLTNDDSANNNPCDSILGLPPSTQIPRGTSSCLYVGRLIRVTPDSHDDRQSRLKITPVVARPKSAPIGETSLAGLYQIAEYTGNESMIDSDTFDWGLAAVEPDGSDNMKQISLLVVRSPQDGTVQSYDLLATDPGSINYSSLESRVTTNNMQDIKFCLADRTGGSLDGGHRMAIIIHAGATTSSDIETRLIQKGGAGAC